MFLNVTGVKTCSLPIYIENSVTELHYLIKTLDIDGETLTLEELKLMLEKLFKIICIVKDIKLNIDVQDEYQLLNCDSKTIVYILTDIINYLIEFDTMEINIEAKKENGKVLIYIKNNIKNIELISKLHKLAMFDKNIDILVEDRIVIEILNN